MSTPTQPTDVEVGQMWKDNDQRTRGAGEFTILAVVDPGIAVKAMLDEEDRSEQFKRMIREAQRDGRTYVIVTRGHQLSRIRVDRLLRSSHLQRGYTYIGMSR